MLITLGDINIIVVTDVHGWIAGNNNRVFNDDDAANYGDVLSFIIQLQKKTNNNKNNVLFVMNGDFMDGTGLSISTNPTSSIQYLFSILQRMPFNAINVGNHELYHSETIEYMRKKNGFIEHWNGNYLSSNTIYTPTNTTLGNQYTYLNAGQYNILTFGFLYNFKTNYYDSNNIRVIPVQDIVQEVWFRTVLLNNTDKYDIILILAHMDCEDILIHDILLPTIRTYTNKPVVFLAGHTHRRCYIQYNNDTVAIMEAGHFLDTIGFISINLNNKSNNNNTIIDNNSMFHHTFINATRNDLMKVLGSSTNNNDFDTKQGKELTNLIQTTRSQLYLNDVMGCSERHYYLEKPIYDHNSLYRLYMKEIILNTILKDNTFKKQIYIQGTGALRYDLLPGVIVRDDLIAVSPFNDTIYTICNNLNITTILSLLDLLNNDVSNNNSTTTTTTEDKLPNFVSSIPFQKVSNDTNHYEIISTAFEVPWLLTSLEEYFNVKHCIPELICCQTSTDLWLTYFEKYGNKTQCTTKTSSSSTDISLTLAVSTRLPVITAPTNPMILFVVFVVLAMFSLLFVQKKKSTKNTDYKNNNNINVSKSGFKYGAIIV